MFRRQWSIESALIGGVVGAALTTGFMPGLTAAGLARIEVVTSMLLTGALVLVTYRYVVVTQSIAEASEKQSAAFLSQLDLDLVPKLIGAVSEGSSSILGRDENTFTLINLSRHPVWIDAVEFVPLQYRSVFPRHELKGGRGLNPGEKAERDLHGAAGGNASVKISYYYGPTGGQLHTAQWRVERQPSGELAAIEGVDH